MRMKNMKMYCFFAWLMTMYGAPVQGQVSLGNFIYGDFKDQVANCATVMPNGRSRMAGFTRSSTTDLQAASGYLLEEYAVTQTTLTLSRKYNQGSEPFIINAIAAHPTNGNMAAVATSKPGAQTHTDAVFMDLSSSGAVLHSRTWNSLGDESARQVKILADGSFLIVGRTTINGLPQAFMTRLAAAPSYAPIFHRVIGKTTASPVTKDEAVAVDQLPNGRILVAGNTQHFSRTVEGSIFLVLLELDGTIVDYHTYQLDASVFGPVAKDMVILSDGSVVVVGTTQQVQGSNVTNGFILKADPSLASATCSEISQPGQITRIEDFRAVVSVPATNQFVVAGSAMVSNSGVVSSDALLLKFDNPGNILIANAFRVGGAASNEVYNDVILRDNNTTVQAVGFTSSGSLTFFGGLNVLSSRFSLNLGFCFTQSLALQVVPKSVTHIAPNEQSQTTMSMVIGTLSNVSFASFAESPCHSGKTDYVASDETALEAATVPLVTELFPNPARGFATLRIADLEGTATIDVTDLSGRVLRQMKVDEAEMQLDLSAMSPGLYMVNIATAKARVSKKLVVQ
jgi:Secretion system C-terminal sorting domain